MNPLYLGPESVHVWVVTDESGLLGTPQNLQVVPQKLQGSFRRRREEPAKSGLSAGSNLTRFLRVPVSCVGFLHVEQLTLVLSTSKS